MNLGRLQHLLQPIQKLVRLEIVFDICLKESLQWSLVNFLIYYFVFVLMSHLNARLCQTFLKCRGKNLLLCTHHQRAWRFYGYLVRNNDKGVSWFKSRLNLKYQVIFNEKRKHVVVQHPFKDFFTYWKKWNWPIVLYWLSVVFL